MRCCAFLFLLLQVLGGLGFPLFELSSKADDVLQTALNQLNARIDRTNLYRVSKASVKRIVPLGTNTFDLHLRFAIRETECQKSSGLDPQGCMYRKGFFVSEAGCYVRARVSQDLTRIISLRCTKTDSSSSESSEEGWLGLHYDLNHFGTRDRTHSTSAPSLIIASPIRSGHRDGTEAVHVRGNHFDNHLPYH
ncbi:secreted phosphoprotein 24 [Puntigrus tetrazona]|uniref:secreted phosphoprotein 24 n=1 Tax=Puntigrus tetrazona TaxID=1606681 RepID=UPI001C8A1F60|nr:secreted phosphoprotein 24 [Puntigrus tetrazona]